MSKGSRIKALRESAGLSQVELADAIKVSKQTLFKYENDIITNIPSDKIEEIARICGSAPSYIMGWTKISADEELSSLISKLDNADKDNLKLYINNMLLSQPKYQLKKDTIA